MLFFLFIIIYCLIVTGSLHLVEFPTQYTGNISIASGFLRLIPTGAREGQATPRCFVMWLRRVMLNPPFGDFLPCTYRSTYGSQIMSAPTTRSPTCPLGKFYLCECFHNRITFFSRA